MNAAVQSAGCVVFVIDESAAMDAEVEDAIPTGAAPLAAAQSRKKKSASVATALNSLLSRLPNTADFDVAVVGYRTDSAGEPAVGCRWGGTLAGREFVPLSELKNAPLSVEERVRKRPNPAGFGAPVEETVRFPIWYVPQTGAKAPQVAAFQFCRDLLAKWSSSAGPNPGTPMVVHILGGGSTDGNPLKVIQEIRAIEFSTGNPLVTHAHLSTSKSVLATLYPASRYHMRPGLMKDLFDRSSPLPAAMVPHLKESNVIIGEGAVCMLYNAKMVDVAQFLRLVEVHTKNWPARSAAAVALAAPIPPTVSGTAEPSEAKLAASDTPADQLPLTLDAAPPVAAPEIPPTGGEKAAIVVFVLDRSVADPFGAGAQNPCSKLQEQLNEMLAHLGKRQTGKVDAAVVTYGVDALQEADVRTEFDGPLAGKTIVRDSELADGALRVDQLEQQVDNGVGGLMTITVKKPIFVEVEPSAAASPVAGFSAAGKIVADWRGQHPQTCLPPVVLHMTRAKSDAAAVEQAVGHLRDVAGPIVLYHLVSTEEPHPSACYPDNGQALQQDTIRQLFDLSSPLLDSQRLAAEKPAIVKTESRGLVVNGKFDLLFDGVTAAIGD